MKSLFPDLLFATCPDRDICGMRHLITPDLAHKAIICQRCGSRFLASPLTVEQAFPRPRPRNNGHKPNNTQTQSTSEWTPTPMPHPIPASAKPAATPAAKAAATPAPTPAKPATPATPVASDTPPSKGRSLPPVRHTSPSVDAPPADPAGPPPPAPPPSRPVAAALVDAPPDFEQRLAELRARQRERVELEETARPRPKARDEKEEPSGVSLFVARIVHSVWTKVALTALIVIPMGFIAGRLSAPVTTVSGSSTTPIDMEQVVTSATKKGAEEVLEGAIKKITETQVGELKKAGDEVAGLKKSLAEAEAKLAEAMTVLKASQKNESEAITAYDELRKWVDENHPAETAQGQ